MTERHDDSEHISESLMEKITEKLHGDDSSSSSSSPSSDSDTEKKPSLPTSSSAKDKIFRLFWREKPVHKVFGVGKRDCGLVDPVCFGKLLQLLDLVLHNIRVAAYPAGDWGGRVGGQWWWTCVSRAKMMQTRRTRTQRYNVVN